LAIHENFTGGICLDKEDTIKL